MRRVLIASCAAVAAAGLIPIDGRASESVPLGVPAHVAGPSWLHAPLATHPIVENRGDWQAAPTLVSGTSAYSSGEFLFQDFVYDAYGANTTDAPMAPPDTSPSSTGGLASAPTGDVAQPSDTNRFGGNAGDLLEVRARPVEGGVAYRITLNTAKVADASIVAIGIDRDANPSTGRDDWGSGLGSLGDLGLEHVLVTWGSGAELDGTPVESTIDLESNQIDVTLPFDAGRDTWRHYVVAGVHAGNGTFAPLAELPTATQPGGAHGTTAPPVLNVGFRRAEQEPMGVDTNETGGRGAYGWGSWRDHAQAKALAARDISPFHADIDFGDLRDGVEATTVPTTGFLDRLLVSHLDLGEGVRPGTPGDTLLGPVQPYGLYLPEGRDLDAPAPFTLLLHAAACNYNQYAAQAPQLLAELGEQLDSIVLTPQARGPVVGYGGIGEVDTFEAWADVAARYPLDFDQVTLTGISMGGAGTFRLASLYPDLFARAFPIAGQGSEVIDIAENLRNLPLLMWNGLPDELVRADQYIPYQQRLEQLLYRHEQDVFPLVDHLVRPLGSGTDFSRGVAFLGEAAVDRDPSRVTYRVIPEMANADLDLVYDRAYWVSGIAVATGAAQGDVDVVDLAADEGPPTTTVFTEPGEDPEPYVARGVRWRPTTAPTVNGIRATLRGVTEVTLDLTRTQVDLDQPVHVDVDTDTPVKVILLLGGGAQQERYFS